MVSFCFPRPVKVYRGINVTIHLDVLSRSTDFSVVSENISSYFAPPLFGNYRKCPTLLPCELL